LYLLFFLSSRAGTRDTQPADSNALLLLLLRKGAVTGSGIELRLAGFTGGVILPTGISGKAGEERACEPECREQDAMKTQMRENADGVYGLKCTQ
jgi:hypothetical protein